MTDPTRDPRGRPDDDLRALLAHAVDDVEPSPALDQIRTRTKATTMSDKRPWIYGFLGAAVATAATVVAVTVLSNDETTPVAGPGETPSSAPAEPSESAETSETTAPEASPSEPSDEASEAPTRTLPVYFAGATPAGTGLYREFHRLQVPDDEVMMPALMKAVEGAPLDPDYVSLWEDLGATVTSTYSAGKVVGVSLEGPASLAQRPQGVSEEDARLAVQQLVYTATAALQRNVPVTFELNDNPPDTLLGIDVSGGVARGGELETLAPVWVTSPQDGDSVGPTFTVEGQGAFFEANVSWQLLDASDEVVQDGFATAQECCVMSPYRFQVKNVDPGDYTLRVYSADMSGGEGGMAEPEDTKRLTVR